MTQEEFETEEFKRCAELFLDNIRAIERNEIYSVGAIAVVMAFSVSHPDGILATGSALITVLISYVGRQRYVGFGVLAQALDQYLLSVESRQGKDGWLSYVRDAKVGSYLRKSRYFLWRVLLSASLAFSAGTLALHLTPFVYRWYVAHHQALDRNPALHCAPSPKIQT